MFVFQSGLGAEGAVGGGAEKHETEVRGSRFRHAEENAAGPRISPRRNEVFVGRPQQ